MWAQRTLICASLLLLLLTGCNVVSGNKSVTVQGQRISAVSLSHVKVGQTTPDWLEAAFGAPTSRRGFESPDGKQGEIWRYEYRRTQSSRGELLFLFDSWQHHVETSTTCFEIVDGVVMRYWTERSP